jgi:hypothetical protein
LHASWCGITELVKRVKKDLGGLFERNAMLRQVQLGFFVVPPEYHALERERDIHEALTEMIASGHDTTPLCAPRPCSSCARRIWFCMPIERLFLARISLMNVFVSVAGAREPMSPTYLQRGAHLGLCELGVALVLKPTYN